MIAFDEATHTYTVDGKAVPSVTQVLAILNDYSGVPAGILERAKMFGSAVHRMIELDVAGTLDHAKLDPALIPWLAQWHEACSDAEIKVTQTERMVYHPTLRYAGRVDIIGSVHGDPAILDLKTGTTIPSTVGAQTWAYREAAYYGVTRKETRPHRYCLHLQADSWKLLPLRKDADDGALFTACLTIHRHKHLGESHD